MASSQGEGGPQIFMDIRIGDRNGELECGFLWVSKGGELVTLRPITVPTLLLCLQVETAQR